MVGASDGGALKGNHPKGSPKPSLWTFSALFSRTQILSWDKEMDDQDWVHTILLFFCLSCLPLWPEYSYGNPQKGWLLNVNIQVSWI